MVAPRRTATTFTTVPNPGTKGDSSDIAGNLSVVSPVSDHSGDPGGLL